MAVNPDKPKEEKTTYVSNSEKGAKSAPQVKKVVKNKKASAKKPEVKVVENEKPLKKDKKQIQASNTVIIESVRKTDGV